MAQRVDEASEIWKELDDLISSNHLPERVTGMLYEAVLGYRIRRHGYMKLTGVEKHTATRDLGRLVDLELLHARGETRGRHYLAGDRLRQLHEECRRRRRPVTDPYPWMKTRLVSQHPGPPERDA